MDEIKGKGFLPILSSTLAFFTTFIAWTAYGPLGPVFKKDFGLSLILLGIVLGAPKILALPTRYLAGYLSDRVGARMTMITFLSLSIVALLITSFSTSFIQFVVAASLLGVAGGIFPIGIAYVDRMYSRRLGSMLGIYGGLGNAGSAFSGVLVPLLFESYGFRGVFLGLSSILLVPLVLTFLSPPDFKGKERRKLTPQEKVGIFVYTLIAVAFLSVSVFLGKSLVMEASLEVTLTLSTLLVTFLLYGRSTGYLSFVYYLTFGGFLALGLWIPTVFTYVFKTSLLESGVVLFFSVISAALFRPVGGMVGDRTGGKSASLIGLSFIVFGSLLTFVGLVEKSLLLSIISFVFLGSAFSFSNGAVFKLVSEVYTKDKIGVASGVIGGIGGFGGFSLSTGIGIVGSINISYVTLMFLPLSLMGIVLLLMMRGEGGVNAKEELREELQGKGWRRGGESR